ncbi:MAG: ribosomal protein [Candidatus Parcubacteria bacterium]
MAKKKKKEMGDRSVAELVALSRDLEREVFELRNELSLNRKLEKPHLLKAKRRERARALTLLTQKQKKGAVA